MFGERHEDYQQVYGNQDDGQDHEGKFSHELISGGAAFEAMHLFEQRQRAEGKTVSHGFAKELLAGIAGGEVDKLFETKGLDYLDREKAKRNAENQVCLDPCTLSSASLTSTVGSRHVRSALRPV